MRNKETKCVTLNQDTMKIVKSLSRFYGLDSISSVLTILIHDQARKLGIS
jgi:hypothetical protein